MEKVEKKRSSNDYKPVCENEQPASEQGELIWQNEEENTLEDRLG